MAAIKDMLDPTVVKRLRVALDPKAPAKPKRSLREEVKEAAAQQRALLSEKKEKKMDVNNVPDAELGRHARNLLVHSKTKKVKKARAQAKAEQAKAEVKVSKGIKKDQKARKNRVLKGFKVSKTLTVPDLDLTDVTSLDHTPSAVTRAPYNQARFRLLGEPPLPAKGNQKDEPDPQDSTTYRDLIKEHERLRGVVKGKAKPTKTAAKVEKALVAELKGSDQAKVKSLSKLAGISKARARQVLGL